VPWHWRCARPFLQPSSDSSMPWIAEEAVKQLQQRQARSHLGALRWCRQLWLAPPGREPGCRWSIALAQRPSARVLFAVVRVGLLKRGKAQVVVSRQAHCYIPERLCLRSARVRWMSVPARIRCRMRARARMAWLSRFGRDAEEWIVRVAGGVAGVELVAVVRVQGRLLLDAGRQIR
jgi:hypothetical protein